MTEWLSLHFMSLKRPIFWSALELLSLPVCQSRCLVFTPIYHFTFLSPVKLVLVAQLYLTLCSPMDCSPPASSVHGILQARVLEWVCHSLLQPVKAGGEQFAGFPETREIFCGCTISAVFRHPRSFPRLFQVPEWSGEEWGDMSPFFKRQTSYQ